MNTIKLQSAKQYQASAQGAVERYVGSVAPVARGSRYLEVLQQNSDRIQGSLVLAGYDLEGGEDEGMTQKAALAIELLHAFTQCMEQGIDTEQALRAQHEAQIILANLETDEENRLKALSITNRTLMLAALARLPETPYEDKLNWKATELALNPLHVGQVLANADCHATNRVTPSAISFGKNMLAGKNPSFDMLINGLQAEKFTN